MTDQEVTPIPAFVQTTDVEVVTGFCTTADGEEKPFVFIQIEGWDRNGDTVKETYALPPLHAMQVGLQIAQAGSDYLTAIATLAKKFAEEQQEQKRVENPGGYL